MEPQDWLYTVAAAYASGAEIWMEGMVTARRVDGGANNALYHVNLDGQQVACKLCVADERCRAAREYGVLCLLQAAGVDIAAQPLLLDESCSILPFPTVVYRWLAIVERGDAFQPPWVSQANYVGSGALYWFDVALEDVLAGVLPAEALAEAQTKAAAFVECVGENGGDDETWRACAQRVDPDIVLSGE